MGVIQGLKQITTDAKTAIASRMLVSGAESGNRILCRLAFGHATPDANSEALALAVEQGHTGKLLGVLLPDEIQLRKSHDYRVDGAFIAAANALADNPATAGRLQGFYERVAIATWRQSANTTTDQGELNFTAPVAAGPGLKR